MLNGNEKIEGSASLGVSPHLATERGDPIMDKIKKYREKGFEEETYWYGELERAVGGIFLGVTLSFEGYRILWFVRGRKIISVFIDWGG